MLAQHNEYIKQINLCCHKLLHLLNYYLSMNFNFAPLQKVNNWIATKKKGRTTTSFSLCFVARIRKNEIFNLYQIRTISAKTGPSTNTVRVKVTQTQHLHSNVSPALYISPSHTQTHTHTHTHTHTLSLSLSQKYTCTHNPKTNTLTLTDSLTRRTHSHTHKHTHTRFTSYFFWIYTHV